jgi:hypothetical protein
MKNSFSAKYKIMMKKGTSDVNDYKNDRAMENSING